MRYKVKSYSVSGKGNNVFYADAILNAEQLPNGAIGKLIADGFIEEYPDELEGIELPADGVMRETHLEGHIAMEGVGSTSENLIPADGTPPTDGVIVPPPVEDVIAPEKKDEIPTVKSIDEYSLKSLKMTLRNKGIEFDPTADKEVLYKLLNKA